VRIGVTKKTIANSKQKVMSAIGVAWSDRGMAQKQLMSFDGYENGYYSSQ
jgi:hypothetical protein